MLDDEREQLGRAARTAWNAYWTEQGQSGGLCAWETLRETDREVDRRIGEAVARLVRDRDQAGAAPAGLDPLDILDEHRELLATLQRRMGEVESQQDRLTERIEQLQAGSPTS